MWGGGGGETTYCFFNTSLCFFVFIIAPVVIAIDVFFSFLSFFFQTRLGLALQKNHLITMFFRTFHEGRGV